MQEDNKAIIHRFEKAFAVNDVATIDELCDPKLVDHNPVPEQEPTLAGFKNTIAAYTTVFPDMQVEVHSVVGDGDQVATRWTVTGTHKEEIFGIPATGKQITVEGMNFYRLRNGKVTDVWTQFDGLSMMEQLGALPS